MKLICLLMLTLFLLSNYSKANDYKGFFDFTYHEEEDKISLQIKKLDQEFLYVSSLASGVGSNDLGLDRGRLNQSKVLKFSKSGNKILLIQPNYTYRVTTTNTYEQKAVDDAFAISVLWGFPIEEESDGIYEIDITEFLMQDHANVASTLPGSYKINPSRSTLHKPGIKNFPENSEFETLLTFTGTPSGRLVRSVTPTPGAVTVRQHHSFVALPDKNYNPRIFDPRAGYFGISYQDYGVPIEESIVKKFICRHRLEKKNPKAKTSEPKKPIIYYVDRGTPEPIKSALIEGAQWWSQAFEAAGYKNAFFVKEMPEGADLLDVRYNVIQWVHRSTRGWSYGATVTDPRTGEIIKGHVSLGSLRVRQDFLIAQGLISPYGNNPEKTEQAKNMALARIRQLSAHEVGHTLGLSHAYSSSSDGRTSVMDYPHPLIKLTNGEIDLSDAYDDKIGAWDKISIEYGYREFPEGTDEKTELNTIIDKSLQSGMSFLSDATSASGIHPYTHQWDNGKNPYEELDRVMKIREKALENFGENTIPEGTPWASLEDILVPVYYFHRYQIIATAKVIGGLNYRYSVKGDRQFTTRMIPPENQKKALEVLLSTLTPEALAIPERLIQMIPPKPMGYQRNSAENIQTRTGATFDPLSAAETLANMVFKELTDPKRTQRLLEYHSRNSLQPGLSAVLDEIIRNTFKTEKEEGFFGELQKITDNSFLNHLMALAINENASEEVKAIAWLKLHEISIYTAQKFADKDESKRAHYGYAMTKLLQFEKNPEKFKPVLQPMPPQGAPIGMD